MIVLLPEDNLIIEAFISCLALCAKLLAKLAPTDIFDTLGIINQSLILVFYFDIFCNDLFKKVLEKN